MLINLRNALMAGRRLPYDAEVEYLESIGTQWIDTGVKKTSGTTIDCTFSLSNTGSKAIFGARTSASSLDRLMLMAIGTYFRFDARYQPRIGLPDTTSTFRFSFDGANATMTNLTTGTTDTAATTVGDAGYLNIALFGVNTGGTVGNLLQGRIYSFKLYNNGTLVRDLIPVRKGTVGAMYDRRGVGGMNSDGSPRNDGMYFNRGTDDFTCGPDVVPVEYIESHGTEYITLAETIAPNVDFEFVGSIIGDITNGCIFGESYDFAWGASNPAYSLVTTTGGKVYLRYGNSSTYAIGLTTIGLNQEFTASLVGQSFAINGQTVATVTRFDSFTNTVAPMGIFRRNSSIAQNATFAACRIKRLQFGDKGKLLPVRVGTEGAMMDVLTRRIYRNAGTRAFTYGNDLKYPIPA